MSGAVKEIEEDYLLKYSEVHPDKVQEKKGKLIVEDQLHFFQWLEEE